MKRIGMLAVVMSLALAIAACGGEEKEPGSTTKPAGSATENESGSTKEASGAATPAPTEQSPEELMKEADAVLAEGDKFMECKNKAGDDPIAIDKCLSELSGQKGPSRAAEGVLATRKMTECMKKYPSDVEKAGACMSRAQEGLEP